MTSAYDGTSRKLKLLHNLIDEQNKKWIDASRKNKTYYKIERVRLTMMYLSCSSNIVELIQLWKNRNNTDVFSFGHSNLTKKEINQCFRFRDGKNSKGKKYDPSSEEFDQKKSAAVRLAGEITSYLNVCVNKLEKM